MNDGNTVIDIEDVMTKTDTNAVIATERMKPDDALAVPVRDEITNTRENDIQSDDETPRERMDITGSDGETTETRLMALVEITTVENVVLSIEKKIGEELSLVHRDEVNCTYS